MRHLLKPNLTLTVGRQGQAVGTNSLWNLAFISNNLVDVNLFYRGGATAFPLYQYKNEDESLLFYDQENDKNVNFQESFITKLNAVYQDEKSPESIQAYIYAILYSNEYRQRYKAFLNNDFPRIPFTTDPQLFSALSALGQRIVDLHLMKSPELDHPTVKYQGLGDDHTIQRPRYAVDERRVYINPTHYFEGVAPEVWEYQIGGYQVLEKYLKDRKGGKMDDPRHYIRVATALAKTIEIQKEIDALYQEVEKNLIDFK